MSRTSSFRALRTGLVIFIAVSALVTMGPAAGLGSSAEAAAARYQPDGRVREPCHVELPDCTPTWYGNNVYNLTASGQTAEWADCCGFEEPPVVFRISIQNDGSVSDRFRVVATGRTQGFKVRFFRGTTDITAAVKAGTYRTPLLAPGEKHLIKAKVTLNDPCCDDKTTRLVTLTSVADPTKQDAVKLVRRYFTCTC